ncbi:UV DNA damage repair endonuclease UvsE [Salibacterium lacus]|uniref:UV DNA damage endonuclease n=1 Tax=Salibacterium lacus TaxID=1898109 RepID=A0ABW5T303_9BACI
MILRFGYVSHALSLWNASPAGTMTYKNWSSMKEPDRTEKLHRITRSNLENTIRALHFNIAHRIPLYRFSSSLVPLATHPEVEWDYITPFRDLYEEIGRLVKTHQLRTSFHPNQFTLFTSDKGQVTDNAVTDMNYHYRVLEAMGLSDEAYINLHVGGAYGHKKTAVDRFHENIKKVPAAVKEQMTLENDDKTYTASEVLNICETQNLPMMFDYHHYEANKTMEESLYDILPRFFATWENRNVPPKIHLSSPRSDEEFRSHADFVDPSFVQPFLQALKRCGRDVDVMIEAKEKDRAMLQLVEDLTFIRGVKRMDEGILEW